MKKNYVITLLSYLFCFLIVQARVEFSTRNSHVVVKNSSSGFTLAQPKKVFGWSKDSIVTDIDQRSAEQWDEHYQDGATIGDQGTKALRNLDAAPKGWCYEDSSGSIIFQEPYPALEEGYLSGHRACVDPGCDYIYGTSNAVIYLTNIIAQQGLGIEANSNAIIAIDNGSGGDLNALIIQTSNVAVYGMTRGSDFSVFQLQPTVNSTSNVATYGMTRGSDFSVFQLQPTVNATSNVAKFGMNRGSNFSFFDLLPIVNTTSNAVNAFAEFDFSLPIANSNAIISHASQIAANSNVVNVVEILAIATSNALVSFDFTLSIANSNAINVTREELGLIGFGPLEPTITIDTDPYILFWPLFLGESPQLLVPISATLNGNGLFIDVAQGVPGAINLASGVTLQTTNLELRNFNDMAFAFDLTVGHGDAQVIFGDSTTLYLGGSQSMSFDWNFVGDTVIDGQGNTLDLNSYAISIASPGTLTIKNITIQGIKNNNMQVIGEHGTIQFESARLYLESDFTLSAGAMGFARDVSIVGSGSFIYATGQPSTISSQSTLFIENGVTFNYSPSINNRDLIVMEDQSAALYLNGCTVSSTTTGLRLTIGTLFADNKNILLNAGAVSLSQGIEFGDGTAADDLTIEILPGASLDVQSGILVYNNSF